MVLSGAYSQTLQYIGGYVHGYTLLVFYGPEYVIQQVKKWQETKKHIILIVVMYGQYLKSSFQAISTIPKIGLAMTMLSLIVML